MDENTTAFQCEMLYNRLVKRHRHLQKWARRTGTNAYRLYDRDIPEIPLTLDLYGARPPQASAEAAIKHIPIDERLEGTYGDAVSGALYKRPYDKDAGEEEAWLHAMKAAASRALYIPENRIFLKERRQMRGRQESGIQYGKMSGQNFYTDVTEGDLSFRVNLSAYLDTGLFLDARKKRALIRAGADGKTVLNLFAYTCSLSAAAAKGGAIRVDSVDLSNTYLEWGKINFALNCINGIKESGAFNFIRSDVLQFLTEAARKNFRWDIIILDPPSFSNSKKMRDTLDIKRDHRQLIERCLTLLSPGGTLWFSSNARGLTLNSDDFPGYTVKDMGKELVDEDFRGKRMPRCYKLINTNLSLCL